MYVASLALAASVIVQAPVEYRVTFENAAHHEARIEVTFLDIEADTLEARMSRSSPGRYAIHEFGKNVYSVEAVDGEGRALEIHRPTPYQWNIGGHDGTVRLSYTLFADRAGGTYSGIDETHAHLNMPATFMWARGMGDRPIRISFEPPAGSSWRAATQLVPSSDERMIFSAPNLYYFLDSPTELSDHDVREWTVSSAGESFTIRLAIHHAGTEAEVDAYVEMIKPVVNEAAAVFGGFPKFDFGTYTFIADYLPYAAGDGMEHRNSTILTSSGNLAANASRLLGTVSHEFIHAWNIERIRPLSLEPFDFERANMSGALWFGEGFTSYYDDVLIRRAGLMSDERYARAISGGVNLVVNAPGRRLFSPVEMSMQAPFVDAATSIDPTNRANTFISYYTWGAAIALGLDLSLRSRFAGISLDTFMQAMWDEFGDPEIPYTLSDLERTLAEVTGDGEFASDFFGRYIRGREVVDYSDLLANAGFMLRLSNPGGATLGRIWLRHGESGAEVRANTLIGTPLYDAGVDRGAVLVSLDGRAIRSADDITAVLSSHEPGESVPLEFRGRAGVRATRVELAEDPSLEIVTYESLGLEVTPEMRPFRASWLGSKAAVE